MFLDFSAGGVSAEVFSALLTVGSFSFDFIFFYLLSWPFFSKLAFFHFYRSSFLYVFDFFFDSVAFLYCIAKVLVFIGF